MQKCNLLKHLLLKDTLTGYGGGSDDVRFRYSLKDGILPALATIVFLARPL